MPSTCSHAGCSKRAGYGVEGGKTTCCAEHTAEGMVNLINRRKCAHPGCKKRPSFGVAGTKKIEFCAGHAREGMVNLKNINREKCAHPGCTKQPSFGVAGTKKREFCAGHAREGMTNVVSKKCAQPGCTKQPSLGIAGTKKRAFCAGHAKEGMIDLISNKCAHPGCTKQPSFGAAGTKKRVFCAGHAKGGMVDLRSKKCTQPGCTTQPSFGVAGTKKREFCAGHAQERMVNVRHERRSSSGTRGGFAPVAPPARSSMPSTAPAPVDVNSSSSGAFPRSQAGRNREDFALPSNRLTRSSGATTRRDTVRRACSAKSDAGQLRCPVGSPGVPDAQSFQSRPNLVAKVDDDAGITVKAEEVSLSTSVGAGHGSTEREENAASRIADGRSKRQGRPRSPPAQPNDVSVGNGSRSFSSSRRRSKRARKLVVDDDDDVVVLEPDQQARAARDAAGAGSGASVAIKPDPR